MPHKNRGLMEDDISDSDISSENDDLAPEDAADADEREAAELFNDPYRRARRKRKRGPSGKEDAMLGIFGDGSDEEREGGMGRTVKGTDRKGKKIDYKRGQAFVPAGEATSSRQTPAPAQGEEKQADEAEASGSDDSAARDRQDYEEDASARPGIGTSKSGLGATRKPPQQRDSPSVSSTPTSFGSPRPSFTRGGFAGIRGLGAGGFGGGGGGGGTRGTSNPGVGGSFAAKAMAKMGWKEGQGLGASGEGILTPIEVKIRQAGTGLAFGGQREKTKQAVEEARRRGEHVSEDEEEENLVPGRKGKRGKEKKELRPEATYRSAKPRKEKVVHKTYEQIVEEAGGVVGVDAGVGQIIDATGATPREVASLSQLSLTVGIPTSDSQRLPELRHNLRLIADLSKSSLTTLAKEASSMHEKRRYLVREELRVKQVLQQQARRMTRLKEVVDVVGEIEKTAKLAMARSPPSLQVFSDLFHRLEVDFSPEIDEHHLDEVTVGAVAPIFRRLLADWDPLSEPSWFVDWFKRHKRALGFRRDAGADERTLDVYGQEMQPVSRMETKSVMSPYDSLLWSLWLPRVRSALNNDWTPKNAAPAVSLLSVWTSLLPRFIYDNILDQLVLPKVASAVAEWTPRSAASKGKVKGELGVQLHELVFPWLPYVGERMEEVMAESRRKVRGWLKGWRVEEGVPKGFAIWQEAFAPQDWSNIVLGTVLPRVSSYLRSNLTINPAQQDLSPLEALVSWRGVVRDREMAKVLELEFFPKWLDVLWQWLRMEGVSGGEVAQWYSFWKSYFPKELVEMAGVATGFERGLDLMNQALALGQGEKHRLRRPEPITAPTNAASHRPRVSTLAGEARKSDGRAPPQAELTFRQIVEDYLSTADLLLVPLNRSHERTGLPLFRVSASADGRKGVNVYFDEDVCWVQEGGGSGEAAGAEFVPVAVEALVEKVKLKGG